MLRNLVVILAAVVAISSQEIRIKKCNDCVLLTECPGAVYLAVNKKTSRTEGFIKSALCSSDFVNGIPKPHTRSYGTHNGYRRYSHHMKGDVRVTIIEDHNQVCCSEFPPGPSEIENHPNLSLLPEDCGVILGDRIVGGIKAKLFEFPWMVLISYETRIGKQFLCGGTLINSRYVLTAAHCIGEGRIAGVRLGDYDYLQKEECNDNTCPIQDVAVTDTYTHPLYSKIPQVRNDIGLLRLKRPARLEQKNIKPICLPVTQELRDHSLDGEEATIAGWGLTENDTVSSTLLKVAVPIYSSEDCKSFYNRNAKEDTTKNILCAGKIGKDSCRGDSGGPLMLEDQYNGKFKYIQYGVVSHGPRQCGSKFPGVYTDVSWFMKWILDTIKP